MKASATILLAALLVLAAAGATAAVPLPATLNLEPGLVEIKATYNGGRVLVTGTAPAGVDVVLRLTGESEDTVLSKKGRVAGVLWMNTGTVTLHNAPTAYMLYLPKALSQGTEEALDALDMGYSALRRQVEVVSPGNDQDFEFHEFVRLKKRSGLYKIHPNAVEYANNGGAQSFSCGIFAPPRMHQGDYKVDAVLVRNGVVLGVLSQTLKIREKGFPALISSLAFGHGTLYGILASLIALAAGLFMGTVFKGGKGAH
ncbi:MAG: TIGR02186 family protein [Proteobacteria bacterium]|nr:TIGR02186 family protein [Pseudomonadota bacterium]